MGRVCAASSWKFLILLGLWRFTCLPYSKARGTVPSFRETIQLLHCLNRDILRFHGGPTVTSCCSSGIKDTFRKRGNIRWVPCLRIFTEREGGCEHVSNGFWRRLVAFIPHILQVIINEFGSLCAVLSNLAISFDVGICHRIFFAAQPFADCFGVSSLSSKTASVDFANPVHVWRGPLWSCVISRFAVLIICPNAVLGETSCMQIFFARIWRFSEQSPKKCALECCMARRARRLNSCNLASFLANLRSAMFAREWPSVLISVWTGCTIGGWMPFPCFALVCLKARWISAKRAGSVALLSARAVTSR